MQGRIVLHPLALFLLLLLHHPSTQVHTSIVIAALLLPNPNLTYRQMAKGMLLERDRLEVPTNEFTIWGY